MKKVAMNKKSLAMVVLLLTALLALSSCTAGAQRSQPAGPDWSRGLLIGEAVLNDPIALYPEPDGRRVHLSWVQPAGESDLLRYRQLGLRGETLQDRTLPFAVQSPRRVQLVSDAAGGTTLWWLSGIGERRRLYVVHLGPAGQPTAEPAVAAGLELEVNDYIALSGAAGVELLWTHAARPERGIYHQRLDRSGSPLGPSKLLLADGVSPVGQVDSLGQVHLAWLIDAGYGEGWVYYGILDPQTGLLSAGTRVGGFALGSRAAGFGPVLALSKGHAYVAWSWQQLAGGAGGDAGQGECHYVSFPLGAPAGAEEKVLALPPDPRPNYRPAQGAFAYTQLAPDRGRASQLIYMPAAVDVQRIEGGLAVSLQTSTRLRSSVEVAMVYLANGSVKGYQIAGTNRGLLLRPVAKADGQNQLHLAWLQPGGYNRYQIYYASTAPEVRLALNRWTLQDLGEATMALGWWLAQALTLVPLGFVWFVIPFGAVVVFYVVKVEGGLERVGARITLGIVIVLYAFVKLLVLPTNFMGAAPFVGLMPAALADLWTVALPFAILAGALGILWAYLRRAESRSLFGAYLVFAASDILLTLVVYAAGIFS